MSSRLIGIGLAGVVGPALTLAVIWKPVLDITSLEVGEPVETHVVQQLRITPADPVLSEIRDVSIGAPKCHQLDRMEAIEAADQILEDRLTIKEPEIFDLGRSSFLTPCTLARAYEVSEDAKYLAAAVGYILAWAEFESSLLTPRGLVFNDHATAARAVVVIDVWRLYRQSDAFRMDDAVRLVTYVKKLALLLRYERLYEYRTNHGVMQSLSLLYLAIAFPALAEADANAGTGYERLRSQLPYFVDAEGVVLEHSAGYHHLGLGLLAAAARASALLGRPAPSELGEAVEFDVALLRPDGTLPPVGDTEDTPYAPVAVPGLDGSESLATEPFRLTGGVRKPSAATVRASAGYVVTWSGLERWPDPERLTQTVMHWADFPSRAHKHADELSISLWSGGTQWVRSVGYWPYDDGSRAEATGWRSSNGPHWVGESFDERRSSSLIGSATSEGLQFFDVVRRTLNGTIRRQLVIVGGRTWAVLDSFESKDRRDAEIVWRLSPDVSLQHSGRRTYLIEAPGNPQTMSLQIAGIEPWIADADVTGTSSWNSGVVSNGRVTKSPAIRMSAAAEPNAVVLSLFDLREPQSSLVPSPLDVRWRNADMWELSIQAGRTPLTIERAADRILVGGYGATAEQRILKSPADSAREDKPHALRAFEEASKRYGQPFSPRLERRFKVTVGVAVLAVAQIAVFIAVRLRLANWWYPLLALSSLSWFALSLLLGLRLLA